MKLTDALLGEHGLFYALFSELRTKLAAGEDVRVLMDVIGAVLESHAEIEERLLFPALEPHTGGMGPLPVMLQEHKRIDEILNAIRSTKDASNIAALANELLDVAYSHFQKEEMILFHLAVKFIDEPTLTALGATWATERNVGLEAGGCAAA